jgi:uncharacterized membrane protein YkvA (DUF1232 family)
MAFDTARAWARRLKMEVAAVACAARDPRTPWYARVLALCVVGYALSPLDLIPDPIPVLGYLDDLILIPLGLALTLRLIPAPGWRAVHAALCAALRGRRVVVYNASFDRGIIAGCCDGDGLDFPATPWPWECAMRAYASYRAEPGGWRGGYRWHKLEAACLAFGLPPGGHRALADALACRAVVAAMAE